MWAKKTVKTYNDPRDATFEELYDIAFRDKNVVVLMADTGARKFKEFAKDMPDRFFNVGVAEQNMMSVAAGLALSGKHVFVFGIGNFVTMRCLEQIKVDICSMNLPVTILGMGTGYGYSSDGPTHHMTEDISIMRAIPGITIWCPSDCAMTAQMVHLAYETPSPSYIRIDKELPPEITEGGFDGLSVLKPNGYFTIVATGIMVEQALKLSEELERNGLKVGVVNLYRLKPVNKRLLAKAVKDSKGIITLEEHATQGGLGSIVCETLAECGLLLPVRMFGIEDKFHAETGNRGWLRSLDGLDIESLTRKVMEFMEHEVQAVR